jgi:hypothetical protein
MTPENHNTPDWAHRERHADLDWIRENVGVFWRTASAAFEDAGPGAIVVDVTARPTPGAGHPFAYIPQARIEEFGDPDTNRMLAEYDPSQELIVLLLKDEGHTSTYRIARIQRAPERDPEREGRSIRTANPAGELSPPALDTLIEWEDEGGCEAACPHHCWVEPDGTCPHGNPSCPCTFTIDL